VPASRGVSGFFPPPLGVFSPRNTPLNSRTPLPGCAGPGARPATTLPRRSRPPGRISCCWPMLAGPTPSCSQTIPQIHPIGPSCPPPAPTAFPGFFFSFPPPALPKGKGPNHWLMAVLWKTGATRSHQTLLPSPCESASVFFPLWVGGTGPLFRGYVPPAHPEASSTTQTGNHPTTPSFSHSSMHTALKTAHAKRTRVPLFPLAANLQLNLGQSLSTNGVLRGIIHRVDQIIDSRGAAGPADGWGHTSSFAGSGYTGSQTPDPLDRCLPN